MKTRFKIILIPVLGLVVSFLLYGDLTKKKPDVVNLPEIMAPTPTPVPPTPIPPTPISYDPASKMLQTKFVELYSDRTKKIRISLKVSEGRSIKVAEESNWMSSIVLEKKGHELRITNKDFTHGAACYYPGDAVPEYGYTMTYEGFEMVDTSFGQLRMSRRTSDKVTSFAACQGSGSEWSLFTEIGAIGISGPQNYDAGLVHEAYTIIKTIVVESK